MKPRNLLTQPEVAELQDFLDKKLDRLGVASRPEVALRLLDLSASAAAQMKDFAEVIRVDQAMSGRVLRLANSAFFAQRTPVTSLERACLVLGLDRIKAISLGIQLTRAATAPGAKDISREVWGQSVFRACLAGEAARVAAPGLVAEAFIIGLMLDAGVPLMSKLVGDVYGALYNEAAAPGALFRRENETLGFTHVDVVCAMARRWRLPELLSKPMELHHQRPTDLRRPESIHRLHRIAFSAGLLQLQGEDILKPDAELHSDGTAVTVQHLLGISEPEVMTIVRAALNEYSATISAFVDVAAPMPDLDSLLERVHVGLVRAIDDNIEESIRQQEGAVPERITVAGQSIEMVRDDDGAVAYLYDSQGQRLLSQRFTDEDLSAQSLSDALGLDLTDPSDRERLAAFVKKRAA